VPLAQAVVKLAKADPHSISTAQDDSFSLKIAQNDVLAPAAANRRS